MDPSFETSGDHIVSWIIAALRMHGSSAESVSREMQHAGFELVSSPEPTQRWFMVVVSKPLPKCPQERT